MRDALGPRHRGGVIPQPTNVLDLVQGIHKMSESIHFGLLGSIPVDHTPVDQYATTMQSAAEQLALQVTWQSGKFSQNLELYLYLC